MPAALGTRAMRTLENFCAVLGLEYTGIDFGLSRDGSPLLFEANATMKVVPAGPEPIWDYRGTGIDATDRLGSSRSSSVTVTALCCTDG
jgi:hypothetical protein